MVSRSDPDEGVISDRFNYRRLLWIIVLGIFALFFTVDSVEHALLPGLHLGRVSWFLTTLVATLLAAVLARRVLRDLAASSDRLVEQNRQLTAQSRMLAQQSERLALSVHEAHHRIKNNLQTVAALLTWPHADTASEQESLSESVSRIRAIAAVHDLLTRDFATNEVDAADIIRSVVQNMASTGRQFGIEVKESLDAVPLDIQRGTSVALIANELLSNALRHAYPGRRSGHIRVNLRSNPSPENQQAVLEVMDDGVGLPPGFTLARDMGIGLDIANSLTRDDLRGSLELESANGTVARVTFTPSSGNR